MKYAVTILTLFAATACAMNEATTGRDQFAVVRDGVDIDKLMVACFDDHKAAGFPTREACMAHAGDLLKSGT